MKSLSQVRLFVTLWAVAYQAPLSMGFSRKEYWSGLLFPSPGDLSNPGIEPGSPALQADSLLTELHSCIFSILVSRLFICNSILFSRFWFIFTITFLNSFSGRLPISSALVLFGGLLSCSFTCWVFLCLFILIRLLCLGWPFCILAVCGSSLLWRFLLVCGVGWAACQGFLVREACVSVLVDGAGCLLSGV